MQRLYKITFIAIVALAMGQTAFAHGIIYDNMGKKMGTVTVDGEHHTIEINRPSIKFDGVTEQYGQIPAVKVAGYDETSGVRCYVVYHVLEDAGRSRIACHNGLTLWVRIDWAPSSLDALITFAEE